MREAAAIIVNPTSGRATALARAQEAQRLFADAGVSAALMPTQAAGHARSLAEDNAETYDVLVSVGGDGTLNEVINGVVDAESDTPIAIIPTGTANVVHKELALPDDLPSLVDIALRGDIRALDLGETVSLDADPYADLPAEGRRFAMCAGAGFDAAIVQTVHNERTEDGIRMLNYYLPTVQTLFNYPFPYMRVTVDGMVVDGASTFTVVGNMRNYGGPFAFFDQARPDDGLLDVCCLHGQGPLDLLRYGWGAFWQRLHDFEDVTHHQGRSIWIEAEQEVLVQIDGDPGGRLPMRFDILPAVVGFCVAGSETNA